VSPLDHADAPLASGALFLAVAEPALFLLAFALSGVGSERGVSGQGHPQNDLAKATKRATLPKSFV
jgi:hypothetical protein